MYAPMPKNSMTGEDRLDVSIELLAIAKSPSKRLSRKNIAV
jgi:hypothetical protein